MSKWPEDYEKYVLEDVKVFPKNNKPVKASLFERLMVKKLPTMKLHANPIDEFSWDSIGPNFGIISNYANQMRTNMSLAKPLYDEPIIVEKMSPEGYMLVNGHHRWFAAIRAQVPKLWISIVNLTHVEDIKEDLKKTNNRKSVAFDLDEVLFAGDNGFSVETPKKHIGRKSIKERFRQGTTEVITTLREKGYDVWVYTSSYSSEKYISSIFNLYGLTVEGIINGMDRKKDEEDSKELSAMIKDKYKCQIHIDNETMVCTYPDNNDFDQFDLKSGKDGWAQDIIQALDKVKVV